MLELLKYISKILNLSHDLIAEMFKVFGFSFTDKQLHFIVIAMIGITIFAFVQMTFKFLSKYSITAISFIYTFTVLVVIVFAIEIQQKITNSGNMEFADILYGLYGFLSIFAVYLFIRGVVFAIKKIIKMCKEKYKKSEK